jgi:phosphate transport system permease protein
MATKQRDLLLRGTETGKLVLIGRSSRNFVERLTQVILLACALLSIFTTVGIITVLLVETIEFFQEITLAQFFLDTQWTPVFVNKHFGIWPLVAGTFLTSAIALIVALPLGLLSAVYLSEYASLRARSILKPLLEILAGIPTVVYGYFALLFVTPLLQKVIPGLAGFNAISPGIVMGIMILPLVASLSEDALHAVPRSMREAAYGLGATRQEVSTKVVVPAALSGIAAAFILAISRAVGETMIVAIAAGQRPVLTLDPRGPIQTMTAYIVQISLGDIPVYTLDYKTLFAVGFSLFAITLVLNLVSDFIVRRYREQY